MSDYPTYADHARRRLSNKFEEAEEESTHGLDISDAHSMKKKGVVFILEKNVGYLKSDTSCSDILGGDADGGR